MPKGDHFGLEAAVEAEDDVALENDGAVRLLLLAGVAEELGASQIAEEAREVAARVSEGRFYVACVGQFKRGKSTLINALIGKPVLPTGFVPVTAIPTIIRFGERLSARIRIQDAKWIEIPVSELSQYVTEELNPNNKKGVQGAEVFVPSRLLSSGMCLVDTPGLGSVFSGNSAATQAFVPHIDAVLMVTGADPPIAGEELALLESVARQVADVIVVLNKADRTTDAERDAAAKFTRQLLHDRLKRDTEEIFEVSAQERVEDRGPLRDWERLAETLQRLVDESGSELVRAACERASQRVSEQITSIISESREALRRPVEESERRIALMGQTISDAERSVRELSFLLMAEQQRLSDIFVDRHKAFTSSTMPVATRELSQIYATMRGRFGPSYRRRLMHEAQEVARRHVLPWLRLEQQDAEKEFRRVAQRFLEMGNEFLTKLSSAGIRELARMPHALNLETGFRVRSKFSFNEFIEVAQPASPLCWLADVLLGAFGGRKVIQNDGVRFLERLIETNSTRVQSDILDRVQESRGRLEVEIRKLLHEVGRIAQEALERARKIKEEGAPAVEAELSRLNSLEVQLVGLHSRASST